MKSSDIRRKYIEFFKARGHAEIPSAPLVPENDPTTLFTSSGMQPLVPYLLGQPHPLGKRLVNSQKSFRAQDIDEVGDNRHTTFFEMLGNWSLGDPDAPDGIGAGYFKKEQLPWVFEFLTRELGLNPQRLYVTVFEGNQSVPKDTESIEIWKEIFSSVGIEAKEGKMIFTYPATQNWWSRSGEPDKMPPGEPGGPDSEVFFDFGRELKLHENSPWKNEPCHPNCQCGRFMEVANSVFMQYQKKEGGILVELPQKNVDFGGGLERMTAATEDTLDIFMTDLFLPIVRAFEELLRRRHGGNRGDKVLQSRISLRERDRGEMRAMRIITDHTKAAVMMMADGVVPSNKTQGYVLRRLIRRALLYARSLGLSSEVSRLGDLVVPIAEIYKEAYPVVLDKAEEIKLIFIEEALRFGRTLERGLREVEKAETIDGKTAFFLYETYGFPWEMIEEIAQGRGQHVDQKQFEEEFKKHQELSRTAAAGMFKGGLADQSEATTKLHTATHLLHAALRKVLGDHIMQRGSHITAERLRFDFSHPTKLIPEEIKNIEDLINQKIKENLPVYFAIMETKAALKSGALGFFGERYGEKIKVYTIGDPSTRSVRSGFTPFSREICGGPHVSFTGTLGRFTITKEESAGAGVRRIYATLS